MRNILLTFLLLCALAVIPLAFFSEQIQSGMLWLKTRNMFIAVDDDHFDPGPRVGSHFPGLRAVYEERPITLLAPFAGPKGTVLVLEEALQDSVFARTMLARLAASEADFTAAGLGLVVLLPAGSNTPPDATLPILLDQEALSARTLGLIDNTSRATVHRPGAIVIDADGRVAATLFLEQRSRRLAPAALLRLSQKALTGD